MIIHVPFRPFGHDACTVWPLIIMHRNWRGNEGLREHEMVHYREQRAAWVLPWYLRYWFSRAFRRDAEVRAYRRQIEVKGISVAIAAFFLATKYRLGVSEAEALRMLQQEGESGQ